MRSCCREAVVAELLVGSCCEELLRDGEELVVGSCCEELLSEELLLQSCWWEAAVRSC